MATDFFMLVLNDPTVTNSGTVRFQNLIAWCSSNTQRVLQLFDTVNLLSEVILQRRQVSLPMYSFRPCQPMKGLSEENDGTHIHEVSMFSFS